MSGGGVPRRAVLAGVASLALGGCAGVDVETRYRRSVERSYGVAVDGLTLALPDGDVTVRGDDRDEVTLSGAVVGSDGDAVEAAEIAEDRSGGHLTLAARGPRPAGGPSVGVDLTLSTPRDVRVARVAVDRGEVAVERVAGPLAVDADRGEVAVADVDGGVNVSLSEGEVSVVGVDGDVSITGVDGDVSVTEVDGDVRAEVGTGFVAVSDVTGSVTATVESGGTDVTGVDGEVRTSTGRG